MPIEYLKKPPTADPESAGARAVVDEMLETIASGGEAAVRDYAKKRDSWTGESSSAPARSSGERATRCCIKATRVRNCAGAPLREAQRDSMQEFSCEVQPGLVAGQRLIPVNVAGCYVPTGRYAHIASAYMTIATAKAAGVPTVIACSTPYKGEGVHPHVLYAMKVAGADVVMTLGGVQAIATLAYGLFTGKPADIVVGTRQQVCGRGQARCCLGRSASRVRGPSEWGHRRRKRPTRDVAADLSGKPSTDTSRLRGCFTTARSLANDVMQCVPGLIDALPATARDAAGAAWRDYGEVVVCGSREEVAEVSDRHACEHLEVHAKDLDWWLANLTCYGSLFLGEETTVAFGDKASGPNHVLPTRVQRATRATSVHKFIKTVTWQG